MAFKIYTKTGDKGSTSLIGGTKVSKAHLRIETYGTVDELNSFTGLCRDLITDEAGRATLLEIQDRLFTIGSSLATDPARDTKMKLPDLHAADVTLLEEAIDKMNESLPEMKHFILPGGHPAVSQLHIARCVCRRAERCVIRLSEEGGEVPELITVYLNRLSDYFFVLARYTGHLLGAGEIPWRPRL
jgi:cob(I)alamin adenosyltransferase